MKIDANTSFRKIQEAGALLASGGSQSKDSLIFYRVVDEKSTVEVLVFARWKDLTWIQKIKFYLGFEDFSLRTVDRLAQAAFRTKLSSTDLTIFSEKDKTALVQAISFLQKKSVSHNIPHFSLASLFLTKRSSIKVELLESLIKKLTDSQKTETTSSSTPPEPSAPPEPPTPPAPSALPETSTPQKPSAPPVVRGISNPGVRCYCNAVVQLVHSSNELRKAIWQDEGNENERRVRVSLRAVLDALDQGSQKAPLSHESEPMSSFIQAMEHFFPDLTTPFEQDAADFFLPILRAILPPDHREGKDFFLRKIRQGGEESNCLRMGLLAGQVEPTVENLLAACSIRSVEDTDAEFTPILLLHPRDKGEPQSVSDVFSDIKDSEVYLENFATEKYNPWLTNEHLAILRKAADPKGKIPLIKYSETQLLKGKAPTFLPINIARFANKGPDTRKNSCPVKPLFHLQVPVQYRIKPVQYKMTGVTVHLGETRKCGHYITYVPDLSSPEINGFPSAWIELNDSRTIPVSWESIEKIVEENATLYMYDIDQ